MKLVAFAASSSKKSINKMLVTYAASLLPEAQVEVLDLNDYEMPLYSIDKEEASGVPQLAQDFLRKIAGADALLISFAEHNGSYTAAYKNVFDWCSRVSKKVYDNKPVALLSASPGPGGASNVLAAAVSSMPHFGATVRASLSFPRFHDNFDVSAQSVMNDELSLSLNNAVNSLIEE